MSKNRITCYLIVLGVSISAALFSQQNIAINTSGSSAYTGAILDLSNSNSSEGTYGFLPPYVSLTTTSTGLSALTGVITSGTTANLSGLLVYNISVNQEGPGLYYWYYNTTTPANSTWVFLGPNTITAANNGLSFSGNLVQMGGTLIKATTIDQNNGTTAYNMIFDLGTGSTASTGNSFTIQNNTIPYIYCAPAGATAANGPLIGIGNNTPGALLNVSTSANTTTTGNAISLTAQQGAASNAGGAVTIAGGAGGSSASGGAVKINAGASSTAAGSKVTLQASAGNGGTNAGGDIILEVGAAATPGPNDGGVAVNTTGAATNTYAILDVESTTQGFLPPQLTTTQISNVASPIPAGLHVYNTTTGCLEMYNGTTWQNIKCACTVTETGSPTVVSSGNTTMVTFTASGSFTTSCNMANVQILEVGGGGGGGRNGGGGGGGGGVVYQVVYLSPGTYNVTVGGGGTPSYQLTPQAGTNGGNSQFGTLTAAAAGGGLGGDRDNFQTGATGGSGGGGGGTTNPTGLPGTGGSGTAGQGNNGGNGQTSGGDLGCDASGGGGAGAGGVGSASASNTGGNGGNGVEYFGTYYGGGGGGGVTCHNNGATTGGTGGLGGGGNGGYGGASTDGVAGTAGTGGGGGAINNSLNGTAGYGGSGVVIIIYTQ